MKPNLVLASASPRRSEMLERMGVAFRVCPVDADETLPPGVSPPEAALELARRKAALAARLCGPGAWVLAADTLVFTEGEVLGKPAGVGAAAAMLRLLSGRAHKVVTAVALAREDREYTRTVTTEVRFAELSEEAVRWYAATGEGLDKAGGYGIQGRAAAFVAELAGSYTNVVGLPLAETMELLVLAGLFEWKADQWAT